ncbi:MAG: hypothetical protein AABZ76_16310 [Pseudomonadota bacterium]
MIYIITTLAVFMFLALCGVCSRLKKAEEHIEIIRVALDRHLTDGTDYRTPYKGNWSVQYGNRTWDGKLGGDA